jgi:hypothetical protein
MSARLSDSARSTIEHAVKALLRRMINTRTPLDVVFGDGYAFRASNLALPALMQDAIGVANSLDAHGGKELWERRRWAQVPVQLSSGDVYVMYLHDKHCANATAFLSYAHSTYVPVGKLGIDEDQLVVWLKHEDFVNRACAGVLLTLRDLLEMATTVGQVVRMAPDLEKYLPSDKLAAFQRQSVKSPFPRDFAGYNRSWVREMQNVLAHCYLLPEARGYKHPDEIQPPYFEVTSALRMSWGRKPTSELPHEGARDNLWSPPSHSVTGERAPLGHQEVRFGHDA